VENFVKRRLENPGEIPKSEITYRYGAQRMRLKLCAILISSFGKPQTGIRRSWHLSIRFSESYRGCPSIFGPIPQLVLMSQDVLNVLENFLRVNWVKFYFIFFVTLRLQHTSQWKRYLINLNYGHRG
jgi:hypothetical protein